jgi:hypothetical protein
MVVSSVVLMAEEKVALMAEMKADHSVQWMDL